MIETTDTCIEHQRLVERILQDAGQTGYRVYLAVEPDIFLHSSYVVKVRSESSDIDDASQHVLTLLAVLENNQECADLFLQYDPLGPELVVSSRYGILGGSRFWVLGGAL